MSMVFLRVSALINILYLFDSFFSSLLFILALVPDQSDIVQFIYVLVGYGHSTTLRVLPELIKFIAFEAICFNLLYNISAVSL